MTDQHPITPPPELVEQWRAELPSGVYDGYKYPQRETELCIQAAQWGADQELEACCEWLERNYNYPRADHPLRNARRSVPPTLKDQALAILATAGGPDYPTQMTVLNTDEHILIKRALEALPQ